MSGLTLLLFLSFKGSLRKWHEEGILTRELEIYLAHLRMGHLDRIVVYTYGRDDSVALDALRLAPDIRARISLEPPRFAGLGKLGALLHSIDWLKMRGLRRSGVDVAKTNQISGGWAGLVARAAGVPLFARCGYILSRRLEKNGQRFAAGVARVLERLMFGAARAVSVTTEGAREDVERLLGRPGKTHVSPTYVDTDLFNAEHATRTTFDDLVYVGRLEPQKNVLAIVQACRDAGLDLMMIGDGSLREEALALASSIGLKLTHHRRMQNDEIAGLFRAHAFYILASLHEGLPKSLIESMSSGMICIGTDVPGIADLITDGETGYLASGVDAASITLAIRRAVDARDRAAEVSAAARRRILAEHSVETYARREIELVRVCAAGTPPPSIGAARVGA
jgi:glycosyltransferase involved in cell wall biosynthesis